MSKKWKPAYIPRGAGLASVGGLYPAATGDDVPRETMVPIESVTISDNPIMLGSMVPHGRYKAVHKAFNSRVVDGQIISWEVEMDEYINQFAREHNATLHTVAQAAVFTNYLFIWEMPCP
jgi:hypothetical protein